MPINIPLAILVLLKVLQEKGLKRPKGQSIIKGHVVTMWYVPPKTCKKFEEEYLCLGFAKASSMMEV